MNLYAAIDVLDGRAVRLEQGDFERSRRYDDDPLSAARRWVEGGARFLHVVDLDGARRGTPVHLEHLRRIGAELEVELVQYGGGLRSVGDAEAALAAGADRVVIGTAAFVEPGLVSELVQAHGERIAVGLDVKDGKVAVRGWQERTALAPEEAARDLLERGVRTIVYTSVDRDGTLEGANQDGLRRLASAAPETTLICSGGVGSLADLRGLAALRLPNLAGVIVGKALYERRFTVADALAALGEARA
jgi:phosphoribosylformimino-5-aminoimidazole carboxamide ribotide isomerase